MPFCFYVFFVVIYERRKGFMNNGHAIHDFHYYFL